MKTLYTISDNKTPRTLHWRLQQGDFMEYNGLTPRFNPGYDIGIFLVTSGLLSKAWKASCSAYRSKEPFMVENDEDESTIFLAFPSFPDLEVIKTESKFGEVKIDSENDFFGSMKDASGEPALVHQWVLKRFLDISKNSKLENEVRMLKLKEIIPSTMVTLSYGRPGVELNVLCFLQIFVAQKQGKAIVFTGHSFGGAIAALATLWVLEKRMRNLSSFCLTFGCPLIGDENLAHAIRRERWASQFCHVVLRNDILPRVLVAPLESVSEPLKALLVHWWRSMMTQSECDSTSHGMEEPPLSKQQIASFLSTVLRHASAVVRYSSTVCMGPTNMLMSGINSLNKLSPYRPFGYYVLCSRSGAVCIENHKAVLQMLYYSLQSSDASLYQAIETCITEHTEYGSCFRKIIQKRVNTEEIDANLVMSEARPPYEVGIAIQLEAIGLGTQNVQAELTLQAAGEVEKQLSTNNKKQIVELSKAQRAMAEIEWYKKRCKDDGIGYYDSFRLQKDRKDFRANLNRLKLEGFWDEIIEMVEKHELPEDFQCQSKWVHSATAYRLLVEPLDIANYYRLGKHEDTGHYLSKGRPRRYQILQKWWEDKMLSGNQERKPRTQPASLTQDSCFWGYLEEVCCSSEDATELKAKRKGFENRVKAMIDCHELSPEVFLDNCSFMKWWKTHLTEEDRSSSPLFYFMQGQRKQYCAYSNKPY
eukprot:Gb_01272 [translate_table: standard]